MRSLSGHVERIFVHTTEHIDKRIIETVAVVDTKKGVSEVFRGFGTKRWHKCIIFDGGLL